MNQKESTEDFKKKHWHCPKTKKKKRRSTNENLKCWWSRSGFTLVFKHFFDSMVHCITHSAYPFHIYGVISNACSKVIMINSMLLVYFFSWLFSFVWFWGQKTVTFRFDTWHLTKWRTHTHTHVFVYFYLYFFGETFSIVRFKIVSIVENYSFRSHRIIQSDSAA